MKKNELYLTADQCKHLQELGLNMNDAVYCHAPFLFTDELYITEISDGIRDILQGKEPNVGTPVIPTYTLQEVLNRLSATSGGLTFYLSKGVVGYVEIKTGRMVKGYRFPMVNCLFGAAYHLLCWAAENKVLEDIA